MKKTVSKEVQFCDGCETESYCDACLGCGIEMCYSCREKHGRTYNHAIFFQGSGDGFYCNICDAKLSFSGADHRHTAYLAIKSLRDELEAFNTDFERRRKVAEKALESLGRP